MFGGVKTVMESVLVLPLPPSLEVTIWVVLNLVPADVAVTLTVNVQLALAARAAPVREMVPPPATALIVPPPQEPLRPFGVATTSPDGRASTNPTPVNAEPLLGLMMVNVSEVVP